MGVAEGRHDARRFFRERPTDLREAHAWHRYAHHIRTMPARLKDLSTHLGATSGSRILDYGSAEAPYRGFFPADAEFIPADLLGNDDAKLTLNEDGTVPVADSSFDAVLSTQVLEHVDDPRLYMSECFRVLRPGGRILLSTHGVFSYHPDPVDLWRWTCAGLRREVEAAGFEIEYFEGVIGMAATGLQYVQDALYYRVPRLVRPVLAFVLQGLMRLADRIESPESKALNASVFALVAVKR